MDREKLVEYGIFLGKRFSGKQKEQFLAYANKEFTDMGYPSKVVTGKSDRKHVPMDLFAGELSKAKTIYAAYYETPAKVFWPNNRYYPLNGTRTFKDATVPMYVPNFIVLAVFIALFVLLQTNKEFGGKFHIVLVVVLVVIGLLVTSALARGVANSINMNRNTSGCLALLEAARNMPEKQREQVAFVLLDGGCTDNVGAKMVTMALPKTLAVKQVILCDCIGGEGELMIGYVENNEKEARMLKNLIGPETRLVEMDEKRKVYTPAFFFPKCLTLTRAVTIGNEPVVYHTASKKDDNLTTEQVDEVAKILVEYAKKA
ncbi:MAG: hypothetical protein HUJ58_00305 [Erysipelotrichaceae bacterium]|nr:hypothetical protein [Erysipelotrichaceae bacterium]